MPVVRRVPKTRKTPPVGAASPSDPVAPTSRIVETVSVHVACAVDGDSESVDSLETAADRSRPLAQLGERHARWQTPAPDDPDRPGPAVGRLGDADRQVVSVVAVEISRAREGRTHAAIRDLSLEAGTGVLGRLGVDDVDRRKGCLGIDAGHCHPVQHQDREEHRPTPQPHDPQPHDPQPHDPQPHDVASPRASAARESSSRALDSGRRWERTEHSVPRRRLAGGQAAGCIPASIVPGRDSGRAPASACGFTRHPGRDEKRLSKTPRALETSLGRRSAGATGAGDHRFFWGETTIERDDETAANQETSGLERTKHEHRNRRRSQSALCFRRRAWRPAPPRLC